MKTILLPLAFALALLMPAQAADCVPTTSQADITIPTPAGTYYWDDITSCSSIHWCVAGTCAAGPCIGTGAWYSWGYEEANGFAGLQRADEIVDDTCGGLILGDTVLY